MANHASAIKRQKQSVQRNKRNRAARTRVKNVVKAVREAIKSNDKNAAQEQLKIAASVLAKVAAKGTIHKKNASRKVSRLARTVNAMA